MDRDHWGLEDGLRYRTNSILPAEDRREADHGRSGRDSGLRGDIVYDGVDESGLAWLALAEILAGVVDGGGDNTMGIESRINVLKLPQAGQKEASPGEQQERERNFSYDECAAKALPFCRCSGAASAFMQIERLVLAKKPKRGADTSNERRSEVRRKL